MTDPFSEEFLRSLFNRDNLSNPAPLSIPTQTAQTSNSYSTCADITPAITDSTVNAHIPDHNGQCTIDPVVPSFPHPVGNRKRPLTKNVVESSYNSEDEVNAKKPKNRKGPQRNNGKYDPTLPLPHNPTLEKFNGAKRQFWFFLVQFLVDPSKRNAISWTGNGREFIITKEGEEVFNACWSKEQNKLGLNKWGSVTRKFRELCQQGILTKIVTNKQYAFATEPSIHVGMTPDELTDYIAQHNINSPASQPHSKEAVYAEIDYYMKLVEQEPSDLSPLGEDFDAFLNSFLTPAPSTESFYNFSQSTTPPFVDPLPSAQTFHSIDAFPAQAQMLSSNTLPSPSHSDINEFLTCSPSSRHHPQLPSPIHNSNCYDDSYGWMSASLPVLQLDDLQSLQHPYFT